MLVLLVIPAVFLLAQGWLLWSGRVRRPDVVESVEQYRRSLAALAPLDAEPPPAAR